MLRRDPDAAMKATERTDPPEPEGSWIDVSVPIRSGMVIWPGNPGVDVERTQSLERGDPCTLTRLSLGAHSGTHVDAPVHFIAGGSGVDRVPLGKLIGPAFVLDLGDVDHVRAEHLGRVDVPRGGRLLFKTGNSKRWKETGFFSRYAYLSLEAAEVLVKRGIGTVGIDYLSIGDAAHGGETHRVLLEANVCVIEGLDLSSIDEGWHDFACLPIRVEGSDGAPARAILRRRR
jgi:arylformamidase